MAHKRLTGSPQDSSAVKNIRHHIEDGGEVQKGEIIYTEPVGQEGKNQIRVRCPPVPLSAGAALESPLALHFFLCHSCLRNQVQEMGRPWGNT